MYVYMCIHTCVYIFKYICICMCAYMLVVRQSHAHVRMNVYSTPMYVWKYLCIYQCMYWDFECRCLLCNVYTYKYTHTFTCIHIYMYIHILILYVYKCEKSAYARWVYNVCIEIYITQLATALKVTSIYARIYVLHSCMYRNICLHIPICMYVWIYITLWATTPKATPRPGRGIFPYIHDRALYV